MSITKAEMNMAKAIVEADQMNIGYTLAAVLAFVGIPSVCVLYGGSNAAKALGLSWQIAAPASLLWGLIVYSMIFGEGIPSGVIGGTTFATINKLAMGGNLSFVYYSFMFAMTALAIIIGGSGLGMKTLPFQLFMAATLLLNYAPLAFWFWNERGWGWRYGVIDYAGGMVLHGYAGTAVLVLGLLSRRGRERIDFSSTTVILASLGFFVGKQALQVSSGSQDGGWSSLGAFNTIVAAYAGAAAYNVASVVLPKEGGFMTGSANAASAVKGALVGTVAMASGAALQEPEWAVLSNVCSCAVVYLIDWLTAKVDVAGFDCFMTHAVGGFVGSAMTGLFANNLNNRLYKLATLPQGYAGAFFGGGGKQLAYQCAGISVTILLTVVMTIGIYALVHVVMIPFGGAWEEKEGEEGPPPLKAAAAEAADAARA